MTVAGDVTVIATLSIQNSANAAIIRAAEASGGFSTVADHTARDAMPTAVTTLGTLVRTLNDGVVWEVVSVGPVVWLQWSGAGSGGSSTIAEVYSPSLVTTVATANLYPSSILPAGMYVLKSYLTVKTAGGGGSAGALVVNAHFTDDSGTAQVIPVTAPIPIATAGVAGFGQVPMELDGTHIVSYSVDAAPGTFTAGSLVYSLRVVLELNRFSPTPPIPGTYVSSFNGRTGVVTSQANDYAPSQLSQDSATTGQLLYFDGAIWNHTTNVIAGSGTLAIGANPAATGTLRLPSGVGTITSRNFAGSGDLAVYSSGTSDNQNFGDGTTSGRTTILGGGQVTVHAGGVDVFTANATSVTAVTNWTFSPNTSIVVLPGNGAGAIGGLFTLAGQDETGTGLTVGGKLIVRSGTGATAGDLELRVGAKTVALFQPSINTVGESTIPLVLNGAGGASALSLQLGGVTQLQMFSTQFQSTVPIFYFKSTGTLSIQPSSIASATGALLTVSGQDMTGTGATVGGPVLLRSGTGATTGTLQLQAGTSVNILDYGVTTASNITLGSGGTSVIVNSGSLGTFFQVSGSSVAFLTSTTLHFATGFSSIVFDGTATIGPISSSTATATGVLLTLAGQDETGTGATVGGKLLLRSGTGATAGDLELRQGTFSTLRAVAATGQTTLNAPSVLFLAVNGANVWSSTSSQTQIAVPSMVFQANQAGTFGILSDATNAATGLLLTIAGQDETGTGATVGGKLLLRSGTGATAGAVELRAGSAPILDFGVTTAGTVTLGGGAGGAFSVAINHPSGGLAFNQGGAGYATITSAKFALPTSYIIQFANGGTVSCSTSAIAGFTGGPLNLIATDCTGTGATVGGAFLARSGTGATAGDFTLQSATTTVFLASGVTTSVNGITTLQLQVGSANVMKFDTLITVNLPTMSWAASRIPTINNLDTNTAAGTGNTFTIQAQNATGTTSIGGALLFKSGTGTTRNGNVHFHAQAANDQGMGNGIFIGNASATPTGNPASGGFFYATAGALHWLGSSGTNTTLGPAEPHCPECGRDFALEWQHEEKGEHIAVCMPCLVRELRKSGHDHKKFAFVHKLKEAA